MGWTRWECPLADCDWHHDEPDAVFERVPALLESPQQHAQRIESILRVHFEAHSAVEYLREIQRLRSELATATAPQVDALLDNSGFTDPAAGAAQSLRVVFDIVTGEVRPAGPASGKLEP